jgi:hypothetical protein
MTNQTGQEKKSVHMDLLDETLHFLGKNKIEINILHIGANDGYTYDDMRGYIREYKWGGLFVEPIPDYFEDLKENCKNDKNHLFENCAISESDGEIEMLYISKKDIEQNDLHVGYRGMSCALPARNGFGSNYQRDKEVKEKYGKTAKIPTLTLNSLIEKHNLNKIDLFICDTEGHDFIVFQQFDFSKFRPKAIHLEWINLTEEERDGVLNKLKINNYIYEFVGENVNAVDKNLWDIVFHTLSDEKKQVKIKSTPPDIRKNSLQEEKPNENSEIKNKNLTVVTGLWDIGRPGRSFDQYLELFSKFLETPVYLFLYIPSSLEEFVWSRRSRSNTIVKILELEDLKQFYGNFWEPTQKIRKDPDWYNQSGWIPDSPQAKCEWYNPIVQSKMSLLHDAKVMNPFNTDYYIWLDAGITNTVYEKYFTECRVLDKINPYLETMLFLSFPYEANNEIHGFKFDAINKYAKQRVKYVCRGGLFGGHKDCLSEANADYWHLLNDSLSQGLMGTEESIFSIMAHLKPSTYRRYSLDDNGLIVKFIQALAEDKVELEKAKPKYNEPLGFYSKSTDKTNLYVLGFNFPEQFKTLIESFEKTPEWLDRPRKILINNSTNESVIKEYEILCKQYNFEHIITGKNLGICGGRQLAAEHFDASDAKYYLFFEDDMLLHTPDKNGYCRNGFRLYVPELYDKIHHIMAREEFDFVKLSFTEVFMDNNLQVSWYNVPQSIRTQFWPEYDKLPTSGLDFNCPRTKFEKINTYKELSYIQGNIYYGNWPMIMNKQGNKKVFLDVKWQFPYEQTWMSYVFQETIKENIKSAVLLASPINHNRMSHYKPEERKENAG